MYLFNTHRQHTNTDGQKLKGARGWLWQRQRQRQRGKGPPCRRLGAEIKWLRARGNATLKRSFYAIFKSLSAAAEAQAARLKLRSPGRSTLYVCVRVCECKCGCANKRRRQRRRLPVDPWLRRRRRRRVCVMRLSTTAGVMVTAGNFGPNEKAFKRQPGTLSTCVWVN